MVLVPDLEVFVCSSLRVCMGSPDQSWFLMQGASSTQDPTQVPLPALTCGTSFQDAPTLS